MSDIALLRILGGILAVFGFGLILFAAFGRLGLAPVGLALTTISTSLLVISSSRAKADGGPTE